MRSLPKERNYRNALPHCLVAVGSGTRVMHYHSAHGQWAKGTAPLAMECLTAWGQWIVEPRQYTASLPGDSGQCTSCNTLTHCLGAVGREFVQHITSFHGGRGHWNSSRNMVPHWPGAAGSGTPTMQCQTAGRRCAVELLQRAGPPAGGTGTPAKEAVAAERADLLQCTATLPGGSGQQNSCHAPPHCMGAVGGAIRAIHFHIA